MTKSCLAALAIVAVIVPVAAHAQDDTLCSTLNTVMDASAAGFAPVAADEYDTHHWHSTATLPKASQCTVDNNYYGNEVRYTCFFSASDLGVDDAGLKTFAEHYTDAISACLPDLTRGANATIENQTDFADASAQRLSTGVDYGVFGSFSITVYAVGKS